MSKGSAQWGIRSDQVQKCRGKLPDGIFGGLGLQPLTVLEFPFRVRPPVTVERVRATTKDTLGRDER
jgi:hypothetical protein